MVHGSFGRCIPDAPGGVSTLAGVSSVGGVRSAILWTLRGLSVLKESNHRSNVSCGVTQPTRVAVNSALGLCGAYHDLATVVGREWSAIPHWHILEFFDSVHFHWKHGCHSPTLVKQTIGFTKVTRSHGETLQVLALAIGKEIGRASCRERV